MTFALRAQFLASVALLGCAFSSGAAAQVEKQPSPPQNETVTDDNSQAYHRHRAKAPGDAAPCAGVDQRRSGEKIQQSGGSQLADYAAYVPGLQIDNAGSPGRSTLSLRGVAPIGPSATVGIFLTMRHRLERHLQPLPDLHRSTSCPTTSTSSRSCVGRRARLYGAS